MHCCEEEHKGHDCKTCKFDYQDAFHQPCLGCLADTYLDDMGHARCKYEWKGPGDPHDYAEGGGRPFGQ